MTNSRWLRLIEAVSVVLFFLQALRVLFSVLFGIIYDQIFAGSPTLWLPISVLLIMLALSMPALMPRDPTRTWLAALASVAAVARVALTFNDATLRYWGALAVLASAGMYLAGLLIARRSLALSSVLVALGVDQVLRAVGNTFDLSLQPAWLPVQILWGAVVIGTALALSWMGTVGDRQANLMGIRTSLGLGGLLFLETSLLSVPNAAARWTNGPYALLAPLLFCVTLLPAVPRLRHELGHHLAKGPLLRLGAPLGLAAALMVAYFGSRLVGTIGVVLAAFLAVGCLVIVLDGRSPRQRSVGQMVALASLLVLLLNFLNAFTFTYPYVVPQLRGLGWAVYLAACGAVLFAASSQRPVALSWQEYAARPTVLVVFMALGLAIILAAVWPRAVDSLPENGTLRLATYNIHYGFDAEWHFNLDRMADAIEEAGVDIIALQEVDTGRMTSYAVDDALYLARRLRMNAAYLPTVEHLTGIAVLYKGPVAPVKMAWVTSLQEQTGIVGADIEVGGRALHTYGIWMGLSNEDTLQQITEALAFIGDRTPASFGGDFNAVDTEPVPQAVHQAGFQDPFTLLGQIPAPPTDPAINPEKRIDYVWLRGLTPTRAWVAESLASDHRMVVTEVEFPR